MNEKKTEFDVKELIEVCLLLLDKSKQQDESMQKAIKALESEQTALKSFRSDFKGVLRGQVGESVEVALEAPKNALETQINRIDGITAQLGQAKRDLDLRNNLWYFGGFAVFMAFCLGFMWWFVPSRDEIGSRRAELGSLTAQIEKAKNLKRLQTSNCDKQLCVKVVESKCNYGGKGDRYCVVELK